MKKNEIPNDYELVRDSPVTVFRHIKENKYHYFVEGEGISAIGKDSIDDAVKLYHEDANKKSKD